MRRILILAGMLMAVGALALGNQTPAGAGTYTRMVGPSGVACETTGVTVHATVDAALQAAAPNDVVLVCAGTYPEMPLQINDMGLHLIGPAEAGLSGTATIEYDPSVTSGDLLTIFVNDVLVAGLTLDADEPAGFQNDTIAIYNSGVGAVIRDNVFENATNDGLSVNIQNTPSNNVYRDNVFNNNRTAIYCLCAAADILDNEVNATAGTGINTSGSDNFIDGNTLTGAGISALGNGAVVTNNTMDGETSSGYQMDAGGSPITISGNTFRNTGSALAIASTNLPVDATVTGNTFQNVQGGVRTIDLTSDSLSFDLTFGGAPADANVFTNSGGDSNYYLFEALLGDPGSTYNAEYNDWGLCAVEDLESEIFHQPDSPGGPTVDYIPFVSDGCPSVTASPTPSPTATPVPTVTPIGQKTWGDTDCDTVLQALDALRALLGFLQLSWPGAGQGCPLVGEDVFPGSDLTWGDSDCDDTVEALDALAILASLAGTPFEPDGDCPAIGDAIQIEV